MTQSGLKAKLERLERTHRIDLAQSGSPEIVMFEELLKVIAPCPGASADAQDG